MSNPTDAESTLPPRKPWFRRIVIGGFVVTLIVIALLIPGFLDEAPFDDSDLIPPPVVLPAPDQNMAVALKTLQPDVEMPFWEFDPYASTAEERALIDWAAIEAALKSNEAFFAEVDRLLELPHCEFAPFKTINDPAPEIVALRSMTTWLDLRQAWRCEQGAVAPAVKLALRWVAATDKARSRAPSLVVFLVNIAVSQAALAQAVRISFSEEATTDDLERLTTAFDARWTLHDDYVVALRNEYALMSTTLRSYLERMGNVARVFTVKPNRTRKQFAEMVRRAIRAIQDRDPDALQEIEDSWKPESSVRAALRGNYVGESLIGLLTPIYARVYDRIESKYQQRDLLRVVLALREYELTHGALPETLDHLAPTFVPKTMIEKNQSAFVYDRAMRYLGLQPVPNIPAVAPRIGYDLNPR